MKPITTKRLAIREFKISDAKFIYGLLNEPSFIENIADKNIKSKQDAIDYLNVGPIASYKKFGFGLNMVELNDNNLNSNDLEMTPIGMCGLIKRPELTDVDIGYAFLPNYCGKGYAFEATQAVLDSASELFGLNRVVAITKVGNQSSEKLLNNLGFKFIKIVHLFDEDNKYFSKDV